METCFLVREMILSNLILETREGAAPVLTAKTAGLGIPVMSILESIYIGI